MASIDELISKEALDNVIKLQTTFASIVTALDQLVAKSQALDRLLSALNKVTGSEDQLNKAIKEEGDLNKKLNDATDVLIATKLKYQKANKELINDRKAQAILDDEEAGTLEKLAARNSQLTAERKKLNIATNEGKQRLQEINTELNKNNQFIKQNVDNLAQQKIGIGNYSQAIKGAFLQMVSFGGVLALAKEAVGKLYDAFLQTEAGEKFQGEIKQISQTFFQNLIPAIKTYWSAFFSGDAKTAASAQKSFFQNMADSAKIADELNKIRIKERDVNKQNAEDETKIKLLRIDAAKATQDSALQLDLLKQAEDLENGIITRKKTLLTDEIKQYKDLSEVRKDNTVILDTINQKEIELINVEGERSLILATKIASDKEKQKKASEAKIAQLEKESLAEEKEVQDVIDATNKGYEHRVELHDKEVKEQESFEDKITKEESEAMAQRAKERAKADADEKKRKEALLKLDLDTARAQEAIASNSQEFFKTIASKNKELQKAALLAEKVAAIAEIIIKTEAANAAITKWGADLAELTFGASILGASAIVAKNKTAEKISIANVLASLIPAFFKGTQSSPAGPAILGERGNELIISPSGKVELSGSGPEIRNLEKGTRIVPSDETKRIMNAARSSQRDNSDLIQEQRHKELINTIKNKKEIILNTGVGSSIIERDGNTYKHYFERHLV